MMALHYTVSCHIVLNCIAMHHHLVLYWIGLDCIVSYCFVLYCITSTVTYDNDIDNDIDNDDDNNDDNDDDV